MAPQIYDTQLAARGSPDGHGHPLVHMSVLGISATHETQWHAHANPRPLPHSLHRLSEGSRHIKLHLGCRHGQVEHRQGSCLSLHSGQAGQRCLLARAEAQSGPQRLLDRLSPDKFLPVALLAGMALGCAAALPAPAFTAAARQAHTDRSRRRAVRHTRQQACTQPGQAHSPSPLLASLSSLVWASSAGRQPRPWLTGRRPCTALQPSCC